MYLALSLYSFSHLFSLSKVHLYLKGDESFCSLASPGKTHGLTSSRIKVKAQSSISYAINLLPIKLGKIPIEVTALGRFVEDRILKKLLVVVSIDTCPFGVMFSNSRPFMKKKIFFKFRLRQCLYASAFTSVKGKMF